jgi:hypothetical protein
LILAKIENHDRSFYLLLGGEASRRTRITRGSVPDSDRPVLLMLMAKSRHKKPENVRRYFKPSPEAIAELTSLLAPGGINR